MEANHQQEKRQFKRLFEREGIDQVQDRMAVLSVFLGEERHVSFKDLMNLLEKAGYHFEPDFVKKTLSLLCRYGLPQRRNSKVSQPYMNIAIWAYTTTISFVQSVIRSLSLKTSRWRNCKCK